MNHSIRTALLGLVLLLGAGARADSNSQADAAGRWNGAIELPGAQLDMVVSLSRTTDTWSGSIDIPAQGLAGFALSNVTVVGAEIHFEMAGIPGLPTFDGTLASAAGEIAGTFRQGGQRFPFRNQAAELDLAGTLVLPEGPGPFPAVLFVSGSGPQDRDELIMGHRPFLVLADHLARHGIASLRFDDRGFGKSEGDHLGSTVEDFASDAEAGLAFLLSQPEIDRRAVGILRHSEGGVSGPLAAVARKDVAFLVLLAPPAVPLDRLMARPTTDLLRQRGVSPLLAEAAVARQLRDLELVKHIDLDREQLVERLRASSAEVMAELDGPSRQALGLDEGAVEQAIALAATNWFRSLMRIDPASYLRRTTVPVLALFGAKDLQVAADENAAALGAALAAAGNTDFEVRTLPGLNHLFQRADTGGVEEYGTIEETISPEVLDVVAGWILQQARPAGGEPADR